MMNRFKFLTYISIIFVLFAAGCFEERDHSWANEVLEWEPPDRSTNALDMTVTLDDDETENHTVTLRIQYAGPHKSEDMTGTFAVDEHNSDAVEGEHFRILNESNSVTIPANSSVSEEIEIEIISGAMERGEELDIVLLITGDGDIPPMENYKEFNLFIAKETGYLPIHNIAIEGHSNSDNRLINARTGETYITHDQANSDPGIQAQVDFGVWNSSTYDKVIITPGDTDRLSGWGSTRTIRDEWDHHNEGILMKLPFDSENQERFENEILYSEDIIAAYEDAEQYLANNPDLDPDDYGPGGNIQRVSVGELIFFYSVDRDFYAVLFVTSNEPDTGGSIDIVMKTTWNAEED